MEGRVRNNRHYFVRNFHPNFPSSDRSYLFSSNQLSTLVLVSRGSPKLEGLEEVTQNLFSSLQSKLLINFLFFLSLYSWMMPKFLKAWPISNEKNR